MDILLGWLHDERTEPDARRLILISVLSHAPTALLEGRPQGVA